MPPIEVQLRLEAPHTQAIEEVCRPLPEASKPKIRKYVLSVASALPFELSAAFRPCLNLKPQVTQASIQALFLAQELMRAVTMMAFSVTDATSHTRQVAKCQRPRSWISSQQS